MGTLFVRMTERFGLVPRPGWQHDLDLRLSELSESEGISREEVISRALVDDASALALAQSLTVGETHFMRCAAHFDGIANHVGACLSSKRKFKVLSAGCATGEEPYSVAIAVAMRWGHSVLNRTEIMGVDINQESIEQARKAHYRPWSFRGTQPWLLSRFTDEKDGAREVSASIRRHVRFRQQPLLDHLKDVPAAELDALLFRNVAIYLTPSALAAIYSEIARVMRPGGILVVSPSDPRPDHERLESTGDHTTSVYRCTDGASDGSRVGALRARSDRQPVQDHPAVEHSPSAGRELPRRTGVPGPEPAPPEAPAGRFDSAAVRQLVSAGEREKALELAREWTRRNPDAGSVFLLLGQLLLESGRTAEAIAEFRRATFLAGGDPLARFWYASALLAGGRTPEARRQICTTRKILVDYRPDTVLADGETHSHELAEAVCFLEDSLR